MNRKITLALMVAIVLVGFFLRLYHLDAVAFRGDEAYTVQNWVMQPIGETLSSSVIVDDPHPPLSYILYRIWGLNVGVTEFSLRLLPTLFNIIGIVGIYGLGKRLGNRQTGLLAALIWALHPFEVWHAQDARNYAIWAGTSVTALWLARRAIDKQRPIDWLLYTLIALFAAYIYYLEIFMLAALNLYTLIVHWRDRKIFSRWLMSQVSIGVCLFGWYLYLWQRLQSGLGYGGTVGSFDLSKLVTWFVPTLMLHKTVPYITTLGIIISIAGLIALIVLWRSQWRKALLLSLIIFVPMIGIAIVSTRLNVFTPRYIMGTIPAYILLLVLSAQGLNKLRPRWIWGGSLLSLWLVFAMMSHALPNFREAADWRGLANYLETNTQAEEIIIQTSADASFGYYYDRADILADEFGLPITFSQPIPEVIETMEQVATDFHSIWIVGQTFPDWSNTGVVENWAFENLQLVRETHIAGIPVRQFMAWDVLPSEIEDESLATFAESIELVGVQIFESEPIGEITIWLYWRPLTTTEFPYTIFVHLIGNTKLDTGTPLWSQDDHPPQNGRVSTSEWETGSVYRDVFTLSVEDVISGEYVIVTGFYNPQNGERLLLEDNSDAFVLESINLAD